MPAGRLFQKRLLSYRCVILALVFVGLLLPTPTGAAMVAERITAENAHERLSDSPDRMGGIGDWYLANDVIWAIIDDVSNPNILSSSGGTIVDLGLVSHGGEQFVQLMPLLNMTRDLAVPYDNIRVERGEDWVSVTVSATHGLRAERPGFGVLSEDAARNVIVETEYRLVEGENFLRLKTTVANNGTSKAGIFNVTDLLYWGDNSIRPFAGSEKRLGSSHGTPRGYHHPLMDTGSLFSIVRSIGGFTYVAGGGVEGLPPISYGICSPTEYQSGRLLWGVNDNAVTAVGLFTGGFKRPGNLWKIPFFGIAPGKQLVYERVLVVGDHNDVASATDTMFRLLGTADGRTGVTGRIDPADANAGLLICNEKDGMPITHVRPVHGDRTGAFRAVLPPGRYTATVRAKAREQVSKSFAVGDDGFTDIGTVTLPAPSRILVEVFEGENHSPARVVIRGASGTPDPSPGYDLLGFTLDGKPAAASHDAPWICLSGAETSPVRIDLRPGKYTVYATHGIEYSIDEQPVELDEPGSEVAVRLNLERVIDTPGMMSGDFHVHSWQSPDSSLSMEERVTSFVADGVDLLVATDHDVITDYSSTIERMGLSNRLASIVGVEATSTQQVHATPFTIGHYNSWPLRYEPALPRRGMVHDEGIRPRELYERLRGIAAGDSIIQVNHGREGEPDGEASYFNALGLEYDKPFAYNPALPLAASPNNLLLADTASGTRDIDFDAMELLNGPYLRYYLLLRADWFSLLNQGYVKTATANSDTHIRKHLGGYPRTYILLDDPDAERAESATIVERIKKHKAFGTTGPILKATVNGTATIGDTVSVDNHTAVLHVTVLAAPWVPLDEVHIYANGQRIGSFETESQAEMVRFDKDIALTLEQDTWLVVETTTREAPESGIPALPGGLYNAIAPGFAPLAFTNPIFMDVDGNGSWDPPGMPVAPASAAIIEEAQLGEYAR